MSGIAIALGASYLGVLLPGVLFLGRRRYMAKSPEQIALEDAEQAAALRREAHPAIMANFADRLRG